MKTPSWLIGLQAITVLLLGCATGGRESALPRTMQLGESVETLRPLLEEDCHRIEELHHTGAMAAPFEDQIQVNCSGMEVFGARRDVEFMFNDGPLGHLWVLLPGEELTDLQETLVRSFGPVVYETEKDRVFASGTVALRLTPPEVLVATPDLLAEITGYPGESP